jgi:hypothetical protein
VPYLQVCTVSLCLFETMLSFNMEDVLFSLVFQYLLSGSFLLPELRYVPIFSPGPVGSGFISDPNFV